MVVLSILLAVAILVALWLGYKVYQWKASYKLSTEGLAAHLKDAQAKLEDLDQWKKACWAAERRTLDIQNAYGLAESELIKARIEIEKVVNQKKSSEVRTGLIAEQIAPFLETFPYNPKDAHFLGKPIDFVVFDEAGVHFVEVKSGEAKLTDIQRRIKKDIEENRVSFETFRINGG